MSMPCRVHNADLTVTCASRVWGSQYYEDDNEGGTEPIVSSQIWAGGVSGKGSAWHPFCEGATSVDGNGVCDGGFMA